MLTYCGATDKGGRKKNDGAYDAVTIEHASENLHLLAVADGLGGSCSRRGCKQARGYRACGDCDKEVCCLKDHTLETIKELLRAGFAKANEGICYQSELVPERHNMGTTLVAALLG